MLSFWIKNFEKKKKLVFIYLFALKLSSSIIAIGENKIYSFNWHKRNAVQQKLKIVVDIDFFVLGLYRLSF